jgi:hypothetical protein
MNPDRADKIARLVKRVRGVYLVTVALYVLLGFVLISAAYAQQASQSELLPVHSNTTMKVPTGSSDRTVQSYFHYLQLQELGGMSERYVINPVGLIEMYGGGGVILVSLYFLMFAWYARLKRDDLYPVEVYNGYITERGGKIDAFNYAVWAVMLAYAVAYISLSLIYGQIY